MTLSVFGDVRDEIRKLILRQERNTLIRSVNTYIRFMGYQTDERIEEIEPAIARIKEIEALIGYKPRK